MIVWYAFKGDDKCGWPYELDGECYSVHSGFSGFKHLQHINEHLHKKAEFVSEDLSTWREVYYG